MTTQTHDPVIETKICQHCGSSFDITQSDMDFYAKISPKFGDYVAEIPTPTLCPDCRQRRRLAFRNERKLYRRICDASQQPIISIYSPDKSYTVYDQKIRRSDARDALDYGRDFDFSRTFTEQFGEMMREVPRMGLLILNDDNSPYTNGGVNNKDCYMIFLSSYNTSSLYSKWIFNSHNLIDGSYTYDSQNCYQLNKGNNCFECFHSINLNNCSYCYDSYNLIGCSHCIQCNDLENASYHINNKKVSKSEFETYRSTYHPSPQHTTGSTIHINNINCENCSGKELENCTNTQQSFRGKDSKNSKHLYDFTNISDSYDVTYQAYETDYCLESCGIEKTHRATGTLLCANIHDAHYSNLCFNSSNLFGCIGLRNKEYCIFNKQYTKEEYNELVPQIIEHMKKTGEWGEFFHPSLSPFGYNETVANEYFPVQKAPSGKLEAVSSDGEAGGLDLAALGYKWSDYEAPAPQVDKIVPGEKLPAQGCAIIQEKKPEFLQDILKYAIRCEKSQKLFRLIPQEIAFYTKHDLPLPRRHPDVRHAERMEMRR